MSGSSSNANTIFNNLVWRMLERFGAQGVTFIVSIVLARILDPKVYGIVAIVSIFTTILQVFVDSGLGCALIQKKNSDSLDFSTVFYFNIFFSLLLYIIIFCLAPIIAGFYNNSDLTLVLRVSSCSLLISGLKNVQQAFVSKHMIFKKFFFATLFGTIGAAVLGITMAISGYGVWALVAQNLFNITIDTIVLWITVKWRPTLEFSFSRLFSLFKYGWKLLVASLVEVVYTDVSQLIIGKKYSESDLAYFNKGKQFPNFITTNINSSIKMVMFPVMSNEQDDKPRLKEITRKSITIGAYIIMPMLTGLAAISDNFVSILLTDKWLFCVPYLQIFCFSLLLQPLQTANKSAIKAIGKSDLFLVIEIVIRLFGILAIIISMQFGVIYIALSMLFTAVFEQIILAIPNKKFLNYGLFEQLKDILPSLLMSSAMFACVYPLKFIEINKIVILLVQVLLGIVFYFSLSLLTRNKTLNYLFLFAKSKLKNGKSK